MPSPIDQAEVAAKLTAAVQQLSVSLSKLEKNWQTQVDSANQLAEAVAQVGSSESNKQIADLADTISAMGDSAKESSETTTQSLAALERGTTSAALSVDRLNAAQKKSSTSSQAQASQIAQVSGKMSVWEKIQSRLITSTGSFGAALSKVATVTGGALTGAFSGFTGGITNLFGMLGAGMGLLWKTVDWAFSLGAAILSIPINFLSGLFQEAMKGGGDNSLAVALEAIRKEFGALTGPTPKAIIDLSHSLKGFQDTGLSTWRVFGNLAERLNYFREVATAMGATFLRARSEFVLNGGAIAAYQKALGLANEQMLGMGNLSVATGRKMGDIFREMSKYALNLAKSFELDSKVIGRDVSKALTDVAHFAGATVKQISEASVFTRKLGLELDKITGLLDKFETFDSAAESVANLSQSFGVQVDSFKLMEAQSPAEQLDMLRKSFAAAGKSTENMTRQELKLLTTHTGLSAEVAKSAFSAKNYGLSLEDVKKKSGEAEKSTLTQAEAMKRLADNIERMTPSGGGNDFTSFLDAYVKGMWFGIRNSKEFYEIMQNIRIAARLVWFEGVRMGRALLDVFPGIKQITGALKELFEPGKFKKLAAGATDIFINFFKNMTSGTTSFPEMMKQLQEKFFNFFSSEFPAGKKLLDGFGQFFKAIFSILAEGIKWAGGQIAEGIKGITKFIIDPKAAMEEARRSASGGASWLGSILYPLLSATGSALAMIWPPLKQLFVTIFQKLMNYLRSPEFQTMMAPYWKYIAAAMFGPVIVRTLTGALTGALAKAALGSLSGGGTKDLIASAMAKASTTSKVPAGLPPSAPSTMKTMTATLQEAEKGKQVSSKLTIGDVGILFLKIVAIAAGLAISGIMLAHALVNINSVLTSGGITDLEKATLPIVFLAGVATSMIPLAFAMRLVSGVDIKSAALGALALTGMLAATGTVAAGLVWLLSGFDPSILDSAGTFLAKMSFVYLAMIPLVLASAAIGALMAGPQGIALGLAAAIGFSALTTMVVAVTMTAKNIITSLSVLPASTDLKDKIDMFTKVMGTIQMLVDSTVKIITLMQPTWAEWLSGRVESFAKKASAISKIMELMTSGITQVINVVKEAIITLSAGGGAFKQGAEIFSSVMGSLGPLMSALTPPESLGAAAQSWAAAFSPGGTGNVITTLGVSMGEYASQMSRSIRTLLLGDKGTGEGGLIGAVKMLSNISIPDPKSTAVLAEVMSATANMIRAAMPSDEFMKALTYSNEESESMGGGAVMHKASKTTNFNLQGATVLFEEMRKNTLPLLSKMEGIIKTVVAEAKKISIDPKQLESVKVVVDIFKVVGGFVNDFARIVESSSKVTASTSRFKFSGATNVSIVNQLPSIRDMLTQLGDNIGPLVNKIVAITGTIKVGADLKGKIEVIKSVIGVATEVMNLSNSFPKPEEGGDIQSTALTMVQRLEGVNSLLGQVFLLKFYSGSTLFNAIVASLDAASTGTAKIDLTSLTKVTKIFEEVGKISGVMMSAQASLASAGTVIMGSAGAGGLVGSIAAMQLMVAQVNTLNAVLSGLPNINVLAKLENFAKASGLSKSGKFTIENKDVVVNVNFTVVMKAEDMENAMVMRANSTIRDRLNYLTQDNTNVSQIPDNPKGYVFQKVARS